MRERTEKEREEIHQEQQRDYLLTRLSLIIVGQQERKPKNNIFWDFFLIVKATKELRAEIC